MSKYRHLVWPAAIVAVVAVFYSGLVFQGRIIGDYDAFVYFYPLREYAATALSKGSFPLWNPYLFMGAPFFANVQTAVLYLPNLVFVLFPTPYAFSVSVIGHVLLAGIGMHLFCLRVLKVSPLPAILGALAFALSGFISFQVSHINQLSVSAWLPLLLVVFDAAVARKSLWLGVATGLIGTGQILAGHTQEWYFSVATLGLFALWRVFVPAKPAALPEQWQGVGDDVTPTSRFDRARRWLPRAFPIAPLAAAGVVELGVSAIQWVPTLELSSQSIRGGGMPYGEAISFSLPPTSALYTLLPTYPSSLFSEYVGYIGVIPLVLAAVAVARWRGRPDVLLMALLTIFGLFMAFGGYNPLAPIIYRVVPGLDLFRVPARWLLVYTFGAAGLASLGAQVLMESRSLAARREDQAWRLPSRAHTVVSATLLGCAALLIGVLGFLARPAPSPQMVLLWAAVAAAPLALWAAFTVTGRFRQQGMALLVVAVCVELWAAGAGAPYRHPIPASAYSPERSSTSFITQQLDRDGVPERVLSIASNEYEVKETPDYKKEFAWLDPKSLQDFMIAIKLSETLAPNVPMEYGIQSPDGYDGGVLPLRRYGELKSIMVPPDGAAPDSLLRNNMRYVPSSKFLDLMGVRYVLAGKIGDAKVDNVYYDRGISVELIANETKTLTRIPDIQATSIGLISSTLEARLSPDGTQAGTIIVKDDSGKSYELPVRLGVETAESTLQDAERAAPGHARPERLDSWPPASKDSDYFVKIRLPSRMKVKEVTLKGSLPFAALRFRGVTLIDDDAALTAPLTLSDDLDRETFFDMKVYGYREPLPRAFVAYSSAVRDDELALGELARGDTAIRDTAILAPSPTARNVFRSDSPGFQPSDARVVSYRPEEVTVDTNARDDGYLVLLDAFYPGWKATVDGKETPIERADYLFRGIHVSKGAHRVVFSYQPASFQVGAMLSCASVVLLGLAFGWRAWVIRRGAVL